MSVFAPALGAIWKQLEDYGIDPAPVFKAEGVDPEILYDAGARVPVDRYQRLDVRAAELSRDPFFGLKGSRYFRPAHLGALGFAWLASSSLRTAFQRLSRYSRIIQEKLIIEIDENGEMFFVKVDARLPDLGAKIREEGQLAALVKFCRVIAGDGFKPAKICFRQKEPADTSYHYELFRCPIEFGATDTLFVVSQQDVDKRLTGSNDELAKLNEHIVVRYLAHNAKEDVVNRVKAAIIDGLANGTVTEAMIADQLHTTPRNMHRKLQKEQTSFKQLLTDVRKDLAKQYIQDRSKTLTEISFMLGFSEVSSFSRAFKNWTGKPPSEARQDVA
ncbi:MAG: AraC family transcriptional regulator [Xanthomonadales bacterium]|nr:AraC family transcriptional regulator [Gammaproteobacteria bacterium]MBT8054402.1 AraC family transcriptional regulator [Gammaproteobacteria bacterium]NND56434.1 AraC family transcriptional regulator [Xanthomonadales bacterium]NNK51129.1 AraC family transcriptional regulator [Xanthomonadales bacterium]